MEPIEIDLTSNNGETELGTYEDDLEVDDDDADVDEDDDEEEEDDDEVGSNSKNHAVSLWCQALAGRSEFSLYLLFCLIFILAFLS